MSGGGAACIRYFVTAAIVVIMLQSRAAAAASGDVAKRCGNDFTKVTDCLTYATGKAPAPTKECCASMTAIKDTDPACLCFVIELTHNGSDEIRSLGIQESRLLQLPSACNMKNASISECPKLLGIPPSSPLYAIFTNSSAASASPANGSSGSSGTTSNDASQGIKLPNYHLFTIALPFVFALIFSAVSHIS